MRQRDLPKWCATGLNASDKSCTASLEFLTWPEYEVDGIAEGAMRVSWV